MAIATRRLPIATVPCGRSIVLALVLILAAAALLSRPSGARHLPPPFGPARERPARRTRRPTPSTRATTVDAPEHVLVGSHAADRVRGLLARRHADRLRAPDDTDPPT